MFGTSAKQVKTNAVPTRTTPPVAGASGTAGMPTAASWAGGAVNPMMQMLMEQQQQQAMINFSMVQMLQKMQARGGTSRGSANSDSDEDGDKKTKAFKGVHRMRRRFAKEPHRITQTYLDRVQEQLGVSHAGQVWLLRDFSRKLLPVFGKMRGLWRCHLIMAEALQHT